MATCPNGHDSVSTDFCDTCGMRIGVPAATPSAGDSGASGPFPASPAEAPASPAEPCPLCGTRRTGQFCEGCGYDFIAGTMTVGSLPTPRPPASLAPPDPSTPPASRTPPVSPTPAVFSVPSATLDLSASSSAAGSGWLAVVTADREYFDSVVAAGGEDAKAIDFPTYCPERRFRLTGREMRIGRRSASRGLEPEIDLTGPPTDPGISRLHAVLTADADGSWAVLDPGSANGTQVNGRDIPVGVTVPVHDGDRICIGGWTVLTIQAG